MEERLLDGRYGLHSVLGRGGTATVWRGVDHRLHRPVAVKVLHRSALADPAVAARFDREARTVARLAHPNVVAVHDLGVDDDVPYLVMELVEGNSLAELLTDGPLDIDTAVRVAGQISAALAAAHAAGVVHRDVKPANVLVTAAGTVKVCDFGIARLAHAAQVSLTAADKAVGTSEYMAPEQATGGPVDHRADLYALGCVLYAMLAGAPPFSGDDALRVAWRHVNQPPRPVSAVRAGVPDDLATLVGQLLAKNPADRPADAIDVRDRLTAVSPLTTATVAAPAAGTRAGAEAAPTAGMPTAAAPAGAAVHARAAVVSATRTMPPVDLPEVPLPHGGRFRLGPAGIAVAAVVAVLATFIVVALAQGPREPRTAQPAVPPQSAAAPAPATSPAPVPAQPGGEPAQAVTAVEATVQAQVRAGQLDAEAARELTGKLGEIAHHIAKGDTRKAADRVAGLRKTFAELREDGKVTTAGYNAVLSSLDGLAASLPRARKGRD